MQIPKYPKRENIACFSARWWCCIWGIWLGGTHKLLNDMNIVEEAVVHKLVNVNWIQGSAERKLGKIKKKSVKQNNIHVIGSGS